MPVAQQFDFFVILYYLLPQKTEVKSSNAMELEGCKQLFHWLDAVGLYRHVYSFFTDRHMSIGKWMREENPDVLHLFDGWHCVKGNV